MSGGIEEMYREEMINSPKHYTQGKYETIDVLQDWFSDDPLLWQVGKYIARAKYKGKEIEDLKKAAFYLQRKINILEGNDFNRNR